MAGKIVADTLEHSTAGSIATNYVVEGSAKAWAAINGSTLAILGSLNVASITDGGTGLHSINYSNAMNDANYSTQCSHNENQYNTAFSSPSTSGVRLDSRQDGGTLIDVTNKSGLIHGDLA